MMSQPNNFKYDFQCTLFAYYICAKFLPWDMAAGNNKKEKAKKKRLNVNIKWIQWT